MTAAVEDELRATYPIALRDVLVIECGDEWRELIRECAGAAERASISPDGIKEKYGELRIAVQSGEVPKSVADTIESAETRSRTICEACGAAGVLQVVNGWAMTRCKVHDPKFRDKDALREQGVTIDRYVVDATPDEFAEAVRRTKES